MQVAVMILSLGFIAFVTLLHIVGKVSPGNLYHKCSLTTPSHNLSMQAYDAAVTGEVMTFRTGMALNKRYS